MCSLNGLVVFGFLYPVLWLESYWFFSVLSYYSRVTLWLWKNHHYQYHYISELLEFFFVMFYMFCWHGMLTVICIILYLLTQLWHFGKVLTPQQILFFSINPNLKLLIIKFDWFQFFFYIYWKKRKCFL